MTAIMIDSAIAFHVRMGLPRRHLHHVGSAIHLDHLLLEIAPGFIGQEAAGINLRDADVPLGIDFSRRLVIKHIVPFESEGKPCRINGAAEMSAHFFHILDQFLLRFRHPIFPGVAPGIFDIIQNFCIRIEIVRGIIGFRRSCAAERQCRRKVQRQISPSDSSVIPLHGFFPYLLFRAAVRPVPYLILHYTTSSRTFPQQKRSAAALLFCPASVPAVKGGGQAIERSLVLRLNVKLRARGQVDVLALDEDAANDPDGA